MISSSIFKEDWLDSSSFIVVGPSFTNDLMISPFFSSSRERARYYPFYRLRLLFTLKATVFLFYKAKQSAWRWSEESSINTHEHDAGHSINETADHFIKHICLTFLDAFWGWLTNPVIDGRMVRTNQSQWRTTKSNDFSLYLFAYVPKWVCTPMGRPPALLCSIY